jgi:hypothetical protein
MCNQIWQKFERALAAQDIDQLRGSFFLLTHYYGRTIIILRSAIEDTRNPLAAAAIRNLMVLDRVLGGMHRAAPDELPLALPLTEDLHGQFICQLIVRAMGDGIAIEKDVLLKRLDSYGLLGETSDTDIDGELNGLLRDGALRLENNKLKLGRNAHANLRPDEAMLRTLVGEAISQALSKLGFAGLAAIAPRRKVFVAAFAKATGLSQDVADLFADLSAAFDDERGQYRSLRRMTDRDDRSVRAANE